MVYILAAILIFGILIAVHELGHFLSAKACGVRVNEFSIGMGPAIFHKKKGETEYSLRILPIGGYCAMEGEEEDSEDPHALNNQGFWKKVLIFSAGAIMNFIAGFLIIMILYSSAGAFRLPVVSGFAPEFTAEGETGLQEGDRILSIDGERIYVYSDIPLFLGRGDDNTYELRILRDGEKINLTLTLPYQEYTGTEGETYQGYGLYFGVLEEGTPLAKLKYSWLNAVDFVRIVRYSLVELVTGGASVKDLSGPVGIVSTITQVGEDASSWRDALDNILYFAALIAVNLAVMNLLPLPALDGGKIFFLVVNTLSQHLLHRQIPAKYENYIHAAGFALLMVLMLFVTFNDVVKLFQ